MHATFVLPRCEANPTRIWGHQRASRDVAYAGEGVHRMDRLYITGATARSIRRLARRNLGVSLTASEVHEIQPLNRGRVTLDSLGISGLVSAIGLRPQGCIDISVRSASERVRARGIRSHVCSRPLPEGSFDMLSSQSADHPIRLPDDLEIMVESPCLSFLGAAGALSKLATRGILSSAEADLRLAKLGIEDCSSYALDPQKPLERDCAYELKPVMTAGELRAYLDEAQGFAGLARARRVGDLVFDGSASQMETFLNAGIAFPCGLGAMSLQRPVANREIPLSDLQKLMLNHVDHITPDLLWEALRIVMEYLGKEPHEGGRAQDEDMGRFQDFETLGYRTFPVRYRHVRTPLEFNRLMVRLARVMDECGARGSLAWVEGLLLDEDFLARQRSFFKVMLPAVVDR